jgi:hypothetical protein
LLLAVSCIRFSGLGIAGAGAGSSIGVWPVLLTGWLRKALTIELLRMRYFPSFTDESAYMTTKNANSRVMKSAYDTSQRS